MGISNLWFIALLGVALYCIVQAVRDIRAKNYIWSVIAAIAGVLILAMPVQTTAVKIDLPRSR
ncbi:hypothetical protein [Sphingobium sp.]|uniref:hypothetical protein n=1 Tax=Sphingobium sp. TaxID=1912891 RepID=UPI003B3A1E0A